MQANNPIQIQRNKGLQIRREWPVEVCTLNFNLVCAIFAINSNPHYKPLRSSILQLLSSISLVLGRTCSKSTLHRCLENSVTSGGLSQDYSKEGPLNGFFLASPPTKVKGREGSREEKATSALHKRQTTPL